MELRFTKMQGLGNDFVVVDDRDRTWDFDPEAVRWLCDRHFGVGGDGLILIRPADDGASDFLMLYHNSDGSAAEMCGNGIRCFAKWLVDRDLVAGDRVVVQTLGGPRAIRVTRAGDGTMSTARVDMGEPVFDPARIPADLPGPEALDRTIDTAAGAVTLSTLSMGNPHAVVWVDDLDTAPVETLGPLIEEHPSFPARTNVEFVRLAERKDRIDVRVWERGVGETLACGTGACAAAVVAMRGGRTGTTVTVGLPGGDLIVEWASDRHVYMTGPAEAVFEGTIDLTDEG